MTQTLDRSAPSEEREVAIARSDIYLLLSRAFRFPDADLAARLEGSALMEINAALDRLPGDSWQPLRRSLDDLRAAIADMTLSQIQAEHRCVFGHIESSSCPPYETRYGARHLFQQTQQLADIAGFYRAFGLDLSDQAHERPDHLAIELEFLHFLCFKEAYALQHHGPEQADLCRDAQRAFLTDHLLQWAPSFAKRLQETAGSGWYATCGAMLATFLSIEAARWGCGRADDLALQPAVPPPDGCNFSCGLDVQDADNLIGQP
jgi:DMSO reductase family type II enzyme chaperone